MTDINPNEVWPAIMGDARYGAAIQASLAMLMQVPVKAMMAGLDRLEREASIGPMINPTAYLDGALFKSADAYKRALQRVMAVRRALPDELYGDRADRG